MAKRYSGNLQISVVYDDKGHYRTSVSSGGKLLWRGVVNPAPAGFGPGVAYDSPKAYDEIARSALAFARDEIADLDDDVEFDDDVIHVIRRSPPAPPTSAHAAKKKTPQSTHARFKIGDRVQIPAWHDDWMRGDRYGVVVKAVPGSQTVHVRADKSGRTRRWNATFLTKV